MPSKLLFLPGASLPSHQLYEDRIAPILRVLGIADSYGTDTGMPLHREASDLVLIGTGIIYEPWHWALAECGPEH